ncbi:MAG: DUF924 family protein [Oleiphilus sp.]
MFEEVLQFWFEEIKPKQWWQVDDAFDQEIRGRFANTLEQARCGELLSWRAEARGRLAEIIVLDQFSRNCFRGLPEAFQQDPMALVLAQEAVSRGCLLELEGPQRSFLLMPFMHSESALIHQIAEPLFKEFAPNNLDFEIRHKAIIDQFGRYPHRNAILGRQSSPEELHFLTQPGSSF